MGGQRKKNSGHKSAVLTSGSTKCPLCSKKFKGHTAVRDRERHVIVCDEKRKRKRFIMKNDKQFGINWENIDGKDFKCAYCSYRTKLREHAFRHARLLHVDKIPPNAIKIDLRNNSSKKSTEIKDANNLTVFHNERDAAPADETSGDTNASVPQTQSKANAHFLAEITMLKGNISLNLLCIFMFKNKCIIYVIQ